MREPAGQQSGRDAGQGTATPGSSPAAPPPRRRGAGAGRGRQRPHRHRRKKRRSGGKEDKKGKGNLGLTFLLGPGRVEEQRQREAQRRAPPGGCPAAGAGEGAATGGAAGAAGGAAGAAGRRRHRAAAAAAAAGPPSVRVCLRPGRGARAEELGEGRGGHPRERALRLLTRVSRAATPPGQATPLSGLGRRAGAILTAGSVSLRWLLLPWPRGCRLGRFGLIVLGFFF